MLLARLIRELPMGRGMARLAKGRNQQVHPCAVNEACLVEQKFTHVRCMSLTTRITGSAGCVATLRITTYDFTDHSDHCRLRRNTSNHNL